MNQQLQHLHQQILLTQSI